VIVWVTQSVSVFGSALTLFALNIWLTQTLYPRPEQKPQLALALSAINLAFALPIVFGAPIAGAWADRHDRKRTMMVMDAASGALSLVLAALVLSHTLQLWMLVGIVVLAATFSAFHGSAFDTSYAMLVPEEKLPRANGMMQTIWSLSGIVSPAIAAFIISLPGLARQGLVPDSLGAALGQMTDGTALAMLVDAVTFFLAAGILPFLYIPSPKRTDLSTSLKTGLSTSLKTGLSTSLKTGLSTSLKTGLSTSLKTGLVADETGRVQRKSLWADVREGALYIWRRRPLLWLLGTFTVANFVASPMGVFQPLMVKFNLAPDWAVRGFTFETALALLSSAAGIGGVVGGLFISAWGGLKRRRVYGVVMPMIVGGVAQIVFGFSPLLYLTAAMIFVGDAMIPIMNAHSQTIWQTQTPHGLQGRVFAVRRLIAQFTWPLSTALAGWAGGVFNPGAVIAVLGAILVLFCVGQLLNPYLLRVEDKAMLDRMAAGATEEMSS
jgi:MFS family permease